MSNEARAGNSVDEGLDPYKAASFDKWAARAYWTPSEMAALSLGKHPWSLNEWTCGEYPDSWYSNEFLERYDVFLRAAEIGELARQCPPNSAIEYLEKMGIPYVTKLAETVARFRDITDWASAFNVLLDWTKEENARWNKVLAEQREALKKAQANNAWYDVWSDKVLVLLDQLVDENEVKTARLVELEVVAARLDKQGSEVAANDNTCNQIPAKERTSLDMMIAAMAIKGYCFDPESKRSTVPAEIAEDIAQLNYSLSNETIAKHVRGACERLGLSKID